MPSSSDDVFRATVNAALSHVDLTYEQYVDLLATAFEAVDTATEGHETDPDPDVAVPAAFHALLNANGLTPTLARPNRARFRQNVQGLLQQVQSGGFVMPSG